MGWKCPECGSENIDSITKCFCGRSQDTEIWHKSNKHYPSNESQDCPPEPVITGNIACPFCEAEIPQYVKKCKHCGEWVKSPERPRTTHDDRETCGHCGKKMVPRIITGPPLVHPTSGWTPVPKKSVCPFCGGTHRTFSSSSGEKMGAAIFVVIFAIVFFTILFSVFR